MAIAMKIIKHASEAKFQEESFLCLGPGLGRGRRHYAIVLRVNNRS